MESPAAPTDLIVSTVDEQDTPITSLSVSWTAPTDEGGSPITSYRVEWYTLEPIYEVQRLTIVGSVAGSVSGQFSLLFNGVQTGLLPYNIPAEDLRYALMSIDSWSAIGNLEVSRSAVGDKGYRWDITFLDQSLNAGNQPPLIPSGSSLTVSSGSVSYKVEELTAGVRAGGNNEIQSITTSADGGSIQGYFSLSLDGSAWSPLIAYDASAEDMQDALESLVTVGIITCSRSSADANNGYTWLITFETLGSQSSYDMPELQTDTTYLTNSADGSTSSISVLDGDNSVNNIDASPPTAQSSQIECASCAIGETPARFSFTIVSPDDASLEYNITGLETGVTYQVRVLAGNEEGYGSSSSVVAGTPPFQVPGEPEGVVLSVKDGDSSALEISYDPPSSDGGDEIVKYAIQYDTEAGFNSPASAGFAGTLQLRCPNFPVLEVITIETKVPSAGTASEVTGGGFTLSLTYSGVTANMEHYVSYEAEAMAADEVQGETYCNSNVLNSLCTTNAANDGIYDQGSMQSHLELMTRTLGLSSGVSVTRTTKASNAGYIWTVTFLDTVNGLTFAVTENVLTTDTADTGQVLINTMTSGATYSECTGTHTIEGLTQGRTYFARVFAYNSVGYSLASTASTSQKPVKVPSPPTDVKLTVLSGTSLRVVFSPDDDGGDTITKYLIQYDTVSTFNSANLKEKEHLYLEGGAPFSVSLTQLTMGTLYYVRVAAYNSQGYGAFESSSPVAEKPMQVPSAPTNVRLLVTSDSKLTVTFNTPSNTGGDDITYYKILWDRDPSFSSLYELPHKGYADVSADIHRSYTISDLTNSTNYYVKVQARNTVGYGPTLVTTPTKRAATPQLPGKPYNVDTTAGTTAGTITVTFNAPRVPDHGVTCFGGGPSSTIDDELCPTGMGRDHDSFGEADGGSPVIRYIIEWDVQADFVSTSNSPHKDQYLLEADDTDAFSYTITGLSSSRRYYVRVNAENAVGPGNFESKDVSGTSLSIVTS